MNILEKKGILRIDPVLGLERMCPCCHDWWPMDTQFFGYTCGKMGSWCRACASQVRMDRKKKGDKSVQVQRYRACAELRE